MPKQPNQIIGSFVFRHEGDGCLTSKFHHGDSRECPFTEACKLISAPNLNDSFVGSYSTVWTEDNNRHVSAELIIERHPNNNDIFRLKWVTSKLQNSLIFEGTGMLFNDLLVGTYWD